MPNQRTSFLRRDVDRARINKLTKDITKATGMRPTMQQVIYQALRDACVLRGLEQRTDVEPHERAGDTVPPGASS